MRKCYETFEIAYVLASLIQSSIRSKIFNFSGVNLGLSRGSLDQKTSSPENDDVHILGFCLKGKDNFLSRPFTQNYLIHES